MAQNPWWRNRPLPRPEDPILQFIIPWNLLHHGDVTPERKAWLIQNFGKVWEIFERRKTIPTIHSFQGLDVAALDESGFDVDRLESQPHMGAPDGHALCGIIDRAARGHTRSLIKQGMPCNAIGDDGEELYFFPEWDIVRKPDVYFGGRKMFFPSVGKFAVQYSECTVGDKPDWGIMAHDALKIGDHTVVVMKGVDAFHRAWFAYQRDDSDANLAAVVDVIRSIAEDQVNSGKVVCLFMDGESMMVGGARCYWSDYACKGYELWARLFDALEMAGLDRYFHGPEAAYPRWQALADPLEEDDLLGRSYDKWGGKVEQEEVKAFYAAALPGEDKGRSAQFVGALFSTSDALSVHRTKRDGGPQFVGKDGVTFTLEYDHLIPMVAYEARQSLMGKGSFATRLRKAMTKAAELFTRDGRPYGDGERFMLELVLKLYARYEAIDMC